MSTREATLPWTAAVGPRDPTPLFRRGWEIAAMVIGFVVFWPVGLAILGYFLVRRHKMRVANGEVSERPCGGYWRGGPMRGWREGIERMGVARTSGNAAFDDYRAEVIRRLEEERRKLDEEQHAFAEFLVRLKRAKDQEEFDRFMSERQGARPTTGA